MEKPILFSTEMVRAILDGRKTMTRRVMPLQESLSQGYSPTGYIIDTTSNKKDIGCFRFDHESLLPIFLKPKYEPGDILWVRETWRICTDSIFCYKAIGDCDTCSTTGENTFNIKWRPSIFMPRSAARIFLRVKDVRVERLQDITEEDAKAEGIQSYWAEPHRDVSPFIGVAKDIGGDLCLTRREAFQQLWDSLNAKRGYGWDTNDWVWVIEFEQVDGGDR